MLVNDRGSRRNVKHTTTTLEQLLHDLLPAIGEELIGLIDDCVPEVILDTLLECEVRI
jgi:hypothetical protein